MLKPHVLPIHFLNSRQEKIGYHFTIPYTIDCLRRNCLIFIKIDPMSLQAKTSVTLMITLFLVNHSSIFPTRNAKYSINELPLLLSMVSWLQFPSQLNWIAWTRETFIKIHCIVDLEAPTCWAMFLIDRTGWSRVAVVTSPTDPISVNLFIYLLTVDSLDLHYWNQKYR